MLMNRPTWNTRNFSIDHNCLTVTGTRALLVFGNAVLYYVFLPLFRGMSGLDHQLRKWLELEQHLNILKQFFN